MGITLFTKPIQLTDDMPLEGFHSGCDFVDSWLIAHGHSAKKQGSAVVYVTHKKGGNNKTATPAGFYTLSTASIVRNDVAGGWLKRNAPDQIPVILLGVLGVDKIVSANSVF